MGGVWLGKDFSGIGDFVHLPIRTYSEGMCQRLLFSLLTQTHHEGLAIDESFGTGDTDFQTRSEVRLREFLASPRLLLMASHSDDLLKRFCTKGIVFDSGSIVYQADIESAISFYHS